jgi:hypothetical protein
MDEFYERHNSLRADLACKSDVIRNQIQDALELDGQFDLLLDVYPANAGTIHLNTITPTQYPWEGVYYKGIPIELTAVANPGYNFTSWESNGDIDDLLNPSWTGETYNNGLDFTALFEATNDVYEVAQNSMVELYPNPAKNTLHISTTSERILDWEIYNNQGQLIEATIHRALDTHITLDVSSLPPGVYTLSTSTEQGVQMNRWVKF